MELINKNLDDILDINGEGLNFINNQPFTTEYKELATKWGKLPMYKDKKSIKRFFDLLDTCSVILLVSGTGSGKTVLVPKFVLKYVMSMGLKGKIAVTNPKTLTTIYNAEYGAKTLDIELGHEVGYRYSGSPSNVVSDDTRLIYCTDGLILAIILAGDPLLKDYEGIIIDEAHERQINIDILLKLIKDLIIKRPTFKLIIMSATINTSVFRNYFNTKEIKYGEMEVSGESNYAIKQNWLSPKIHVNRSNYIDIAVDQILQILNTTDKGDILVFIPLTNDAIRGCMLLKSKCPSTLKTKSLRCDQIYCVEVYAKMKSENKELAVSKDLYKTHGYERKVIFATNVAESSITFDGLVFVIDSGMELASYYDYKANSNVVTKNYTSQAQIKQRIGRAGRTQEGIAYHLYTEKSYDKFNLYPIPNINVIDLTNNILSFFKNSRVLKNIIILVEGLITIPTIEHFISGLYKLHFINAIKMIKSDDFDSNKSSSDDKLLLKYDDIEWKKIHSYNDLDELMNGTMTTIGHSLLRFRSTSVIAALTILMSYYMDCQNEIICIMAITEITNGNLNSLFHYNKKQTNMVQSYFKPYIYNGSDHLTAYNIYTKLYLNAETQYLNKKTFKAIRKQIIKLEKYANSIKKEKYDYIQQKYKIIMKKPYTDFIQNIIYVLALSHYYNLIKQDATMYYSSLNFLLNSKAMLEFIDIMPENVDYLQFAICENLVDAFGKKSFRCNTCIPPNIMLDLIKNEYLYIDHSKLIKSKIKT